MAKIIQFTGWYRSDVNVGGEIKERKININADHINTITAATEDNITATRMDMISYHPSLLGNSVFTKLSVEEVIKLING